jgi:hypothetical protein
MHASGTFFLVPWLTLARYMFSLINFYWQPRTTKRTQIHCRIVFAVLKMNNLPVTA